jgi:class 3 adenylate cyclase
MNNDVQRLIIKPIERMVDLVDKISANPLGTKYEMLGEEDGFVQGMETTILLSTITKIGGLMKVGFGEAGANIIARNLRDSSTGKMNLMAEGELITSIFGFCDVRNFTDTTECLQEEVMLFVNRIAHILHGIIAQCSGSANKNIGDAFLLTWKLDELCTEGDITSLADQALFAFCKTFIELIRYEEFICNFSLAATQRLYKRFPDYHVRIGAGLHVGWAIEGAIGSQRKIDASYLSPHVNFTEFLESSTKEYGVSLLISEPLYKLFSPTAQKHCRQVDRVRRSHDEDPVSLYTYDIDLTLPFADLNRKRPIQQPEQSNSAGRGLSSLRMAAMRVVTENRRGSITAAPQLGALAEGSEAPPAGTGPSISMLNPRRGSVHAAIATAREADQKSAGQLRTNTSAPVINVPLYDPSLWDTDIDVVDLRHRVNDVFRAIWAEGMAYYINGGSDWQKARDKFQETMRMSKNKDGPSKLLISILDKHLGSCPHDWAGYRDLEGGGH